MLVGYTRWIRQGTSLYNHLFIFASSTLFRIFIKTISFLSKRKHYAVKRHHLGHIIECLFDVHKSYKCLWSVGARVFRRSLKIAIFKMLKVELHTLPGPVQGVGEVFLDTRPRTFKGPVFYLTKITQTKTKTILLF